MICALCGRKLKNQSSIELGYGPVCYKKVFGNIIINRKTKEVSSGNKHNDSINSNIPGQMNLEDYLHNK